MATFRPDAHPESTSVDGYCSQTYTVGVGDSWSVIQGAAGSAAVDDSGENIVTMRSDPTSGKWNILRRAGLLFDTSSIPVNATIVAAILGVSLESVSKSFSVNSFGFNIYSFAPASNNALVAGDYDAFGTTELSTTKPFDDLPVITGTWIEWELNAAGLAAINKGGITKLGIREANYDAPNIEPVWESAKSVFFDFAAAELAEAEPYLIVVFGGASRFILIP